MKFSSFGHAWRGLKFLFRTQSHARVHAVVAGMVVTLGWWLKIPAHDWCWLIMAVALVIGAEAFNTAIERLADRLTREHDVLIGQAKDLAAGAVLCVALGAAGIGFVILGPPLWARVFG